MEPLFKILSLILVICAPITHAAENLKLIVSSTKLPVARARHSAVYDGDDTIYIIAGSNGTWQDTVLKFSLDAGEVQVIGTFREVGFGAAIMHGEDAVMHFGGLDMQDSQYSSRVHSYSTRYQNYTLVNSLPVPMGDMALAWDSSNAVAYIFGGQDGTGTVFDHVLRYNVASNQMDRVASLPEVRFGASAVWTNAGVGYVFGGDAATLPGTTTRRDILRFNPVLGSVTKLFATLPYDAVYSCTLFANGRVYLIAPFALVEFNPDNAVAEILEVNGWPRLLLDTACVYVPKLDRIYIIGGSGTYDNSAAKYRDEISYVDLNSIYSSADSSYN